MMCGKPIDNVTYCSTTYYVLGIPMVISWAVCRACEAASKINWKRSCFICVPYVCRVMPVIQADRPLTIYCCHCVVVFSIHVDSDLQFLGFGLLVAAIFIILDNNRRSVTPSPYTLVVLDFWKGNVCPSRPSLAC
jgi:hypothetical protein